MQSAAREAGQIAGAVAFSALAVAPHAVNDAVEHTSVHTQVAEAPTIASYYPGSTRVNVLNQGNFYLPKTIEGVGVRGDMVGLPRFKGFDDLIAYFSPKQLDIYGSMVDSPEEAISGPKQDLADAAQARGIDYELKWGGVGSLVIYLAGGVIRARRKLVETEKELKLARGGTPTAGSAPQENNEPAVLAETPGMQSFDKLDGDRESFPIRKARIAETWLMNRAQTLGAAALALVMSGTVAYSQHEAWLESKPLPDNLSAVAGLQGTPLEGLMTDNPDLARDLVKGYKYADKLKDRRTDKREAFEEKVEPQLASGIENLEDLRENEVLVPIVTDMHASKAGMKINRWVLSFLQNRFGKEKTTVQLNLGDLSQAGDFQRQAVIDQADAGEDISHILTLGNHDTSKVRGWLKKTKFMILDGYLKLNNLTVYGRPDVQETPFLDSSTFPGDIKSEVELGEQVAADLAEDPTDILNLHQPPALAAALGIENITQELTSPEHTDLTSCDFEGIGEGNAEEPRAALAAAGHWHDQYPLKTYCFKNGEWTVLDVQGSAGGANETPTVNDWSDPDGVPIKDIDGRIFIYNTKYDSITGAIDIVVTPQGVVQPIQRIDIGTPDGAPFVSFKAGGKNVTARPPKQ